MTFRELFGSYSGPAAIVIGLTLGWLWKKEQKRKLRLLGIGIDTSDPLWTSALEKARASIPRFVELTRDNPGRSFVKYALETTTGVKEHVWGPVLALGDGAVTVGLDTRPFDGRPVVSPSVRAKARRYRGLARRFERRKDHGAYTARAQFAYARRLGIEIPAEHLAIEKNLVDA